MKPREFLQVDPALLHLPSLRRDGADPVKLHRQLATHGMSIDGMPPLEVKRGADGELVIYDGVTRATRVAKYLPGTLVTVEVTGQLKSASRCIAQSRRKAMTASEQTRLDLLAALATLSRIRPEWRLGQTMANLAMTAGRLDSGGVWDLEDEEALAAARTLIEEHSEARPGAVEPLPGLTSQELAEPRRGG